LERALARALPFHPAGWPSSLEAHQMSANVSGVSTSPVADLASALMKTYDANRDQQLSTTEFRSFLTQLLGQVAGTTNSTLSTTLALNPRATTSSLARSRPTICCGC
jgi:hypothetical protein